ncbi:hypothetical protein S1361_01680 [Streptomyces cyanogenus]|uniref:Uncharacterized protein n=1 Tax=Streptomyces cyanogenus TaxID=80860 RepID=A0ABX7TKB1_STRCY|nr:hypothetical protein S1361_01680 [Streptomyces cyanogenus]
MAGSPGDGSFTDTVLPRCDGSPGRLVGGACGGPAGLGQSQQAGAGIVRVWVPLYVSLSDQFLDHLGGGLFR